MYKKELNVFLSELKANNNREIVPLSLHFQGWEALSCLIGAES